MPDSSSPWRVDAPENFEKRTAKNGKHYFVLLARNGQVVGQSQMYAHLSSAYGGIRSVMNNAPMAQLQELSAA